MFIDLDRFKNINDTLGHLVGDKLIQEAGQRLKSSVRDDDTVARLGGDEFVIIMENINAAKDVAVLAEKVINQFRAPFFIDGYELHVTLSIGAAIYPQDGTDREALIKSADIALYKVKDDGRNGYNFYTYDLANDAFERLSVETALRHALERDQMSLFYQPQFDIETGQIIGCEALIRWNHPDMGMVHPGRFIPIAEESGLIVEIGEWVLINACRQMKEWLDAGGAVSRVSVNVSAIQFQRGDFLNVVERALKISGLPPHCLELELTESSIMHNTACTLETLDSIKALNVGLAIDDFGTGYSSLSYLKRLPIDKLKIDRSFVSDIPADANDMAITDAIIGMARSLEIGVIAEGVETEAQRDFLQEHGCNEVQGYLFGKPVSAQHFYLEYVAR